MTHIEPDEQYRSAGEALRAAMIAALPEWIAHHLRLRGVTDRVDPGQFAAVLSAVVSQLDSRLDALIVADVDEPVSGPLEQLRRSTGPLTELLDRVGARQPRRDEFDERADPGDRHGLGPLTFAELGPEVHEAGIRWGAAKAHVHLRRRTSGNGGAWA